MKGLLSTHPKAGAVSYNLGMFPYPFPNILVQSQFPSQPAGLQLAGAGSSYPCS